MIILFGQNNQYFLTLKNMRTIFVLVSLVTLGFLASCTTNQSSDVHAHANTPSDVQYPTSQKDTQATKFCEDKGGEAVVEEGSE